MEYIFKVQNLDPFVLFDLNIFAFDKTQNG